jgi:hypothetical protein
MEDGVPPAASDAARGAAAADPPSRPASNRGFWLIAVGLLGVGAIVVVGAIATRPNPPSATAAGNLDLALRAARIIRETSGTYASADADELGVVEPRLAFVRAEATSTGPRVVSVMPAADAWRAAARASDGSCRWVGVAAFGGSENVVRGGSASTTPCSARSAVGRMPPPVGPAATP